MNVQRRRGFLVRVAPDALGEIAGRHTPLCVDDALLCSRCDEIWPCDSRQLLDRLDIPRPAFENRFGHIVDEALASATRADSEGE